MYEINISQFCFKPHLIVSYREHKNIFKTGYKNILWIIQCLHAVLAQWNVMSITIQFILHSIASVMRALVNNASTHPEYISLLTKAYNLSVSTLYIRDISLHPNLNTLFTTITGIYRQNNIETAAFNVCHVLWSHSQL